MINTVCCFPRVKDTKVYESCESDIKESGQVLT